MNGIIEVDLEAISDNPEIAGREIAESVINEIVLWTVDDACVILESIAATIAATAFTMRSRGEK